MENLHDHVLGIELHSGNGACGKGRQYIGFTVQFASVAD